MLCAFCKRDKVTACDGLAVASSCPEYIKDLPFFDVKPQPMKIKKVAMFVTTDGKPHALLEDAERHQKEIDFISWCQNNICGGGEWSARMVADTILEHWEVREK